MPRARGGFSGIGLGEKSNLTPPREQGETHLSAATALNCLLLLGQLEASVTVPVPPLVPISFKGCVGCTFPVFEDRVVTVIHSKTSAERLSAAAASQMLPSSSSQSSPSTNGSSPRIHHH